MTYIRSYMYIFPGYFLVGGIFPPFRLAVIIVYYIIQKIIHPQDPPTTGSHAKKFKTLKKAYQAKALSKRSRMTVDSAS